MVVGNYYVNPVHFGLRHFGYSGNTKVNGYKKFYARFSKLFYSVKIKTVAFTISLWNIYFIVFVANEFKQILQNYRPRNSITIIVCIDNYFFIVIYRLIKPDTGLLHIFHQKWVMQISF